MKIKEMIIVDIKEFCVEFVMAVKEAYDKLPEDDGVRPNPSVCCIDNILYND